MSMPPQVRLLVEDPTVTRRIDALRRKPAGPLSGTIQTTPRRVGSGSQSLPHYEKTLCPGREELRNRLQSGLRTPAGVYS